MNIVSVNDALLAMRRDTSEILASLKALEGLQESLKAIGAGNPYRLVRCVPKAVLDPELTDSGFAEAVENAVSKADPLSREGGYLSVLENLARGCESLRRKQIKLEDRVASGAGGTGEEVATARELSARMKEALTAMEKKLSIALDGVLDARRKALDTLVQMDLKVRELYPDGGTALRTSALGHSGADAIERLASAEALFKQGEHKIGRKTVKT